MKPRDPRWKALVSGRMRLGATWLDVNILNISSRGLLMQASSPPERGTYVEVHRGRHAIVARVIWSKHQRFGVRTQDRLSIEDILKEPALSAVAPRKTSEAEPLVERRASRRKQLAPKDAHERSRLMSRATEFVSIATFGALVATVAFAAVGEALARPLWDILAALES